MKKIIIAGGSGFLGQVLENYFSKKRYVIKILTRNPTTENHILWDAKTIGNWVHELENSEALINLTGKSVDCRYTTSNKKEIYDSRINSTKILGLAINQCEHPPKVWFNSSTATIYEHSLEKEMTEENGDIGNDFSMNIAKSWEKVFYEIENPNTRKIVLRTSIVFGKNEGALIPLKRLVRFGLGGKHGKGNQKVSWVHELDFARVIDYLLDHKTLNGIFNVSVPKPTTNNELMKTVRKSLHIPIGTPHPKWLLEIGAKMIGTETELILKSRNVIPQRLTQHGFTFNYSTLQIALNNLLS